MERHLFSEKLLINGEFDGVSSRSGAQVVHAGFETVAPGLEVERTQFGEGRVLEVYVQRLTLVNLRGSGKRQVYQRFLRYLPDRLVEQLELAGYLFEVLHAAVTGQQFLPQLLCPEVTLDQVFEQVLVETDEFAGQHPARKEIGSIGLETLAVAEDL